jgi:hypothetical protein
MHNESIKFNHHIMKTEQMTSKAYFMQMTIMHLSMLMGQLIFGVLAFYLQLNDQKTINIETLKLFQYIALALAIIGVGVSVFINNFRLRSIKEKKDISAKLGAYRINFMIKMAFIEMPVLFAIISYLITGNTFFLMLGGALALVFLLYFPTKNRIAEELELNSDEIALIKDPKANVA